MDINELFKKPKIVSFVHDLLDERGITPTRFVSTVESFGGSRKAAHQLASGEVPQGMHASTMLVVSWVLGVPVDKLFKIEYSPEHEPLAKESYNDDVQQGVPH